MAATRRRRRNSNARKTNPSTSRRQTTASRTARGRIGANGNGLNELLICGNETIAVMRNYNIPGIENVQRVLGESAQQLIGPTAFNGQVPTMAGTTRTTRTTRAARAPGVARGGQTAIASTIKLTQPQQQVMNALNNSEHLSVTQISARTGINPTTVGRSVQGLVKKKQLTRSGRGKTALYGRSVAAMQQGQQQAA